MRSFNGRKKEAQRLALDALYAAEVAFLDATGWIPYSWNGIVLWGDPQDAVHEERRFRQEVAIVTAKKRISDEVHRYAVREKKR